MDIVEKRFVDLWRRCSLPAGQDNLISEQLFRQLLRFYDEPWRRYHRFSHIELCLEYFDLCYQYAENADAVELAIWFHDCIYIIGANDNEAQSRDWFLAQTKGLLNDSIRTIVGKLIMDTYYRDNPASEDGKLLVDIDLSNLAGEWDDYVAESESVAAELIQLESATPALVNEQMINFSRNLTGRAYIFHSRFYRERFEDQARNNTTRYMQLLMSGG